jgi:hypothetical protein
VSMYSELLGLAVDHDHFDHGHDHDHVPDTKGAALARLIESRLRLRSARSSEPNDDALATLADQLAYDVALLRLARLVGIDCQSTEFGRPEQARRRLERLLATSGIDLHEQA